ncbi:MAG TPA: hypothetical protein DDY98_07145 [Ruminococcaceae bacterium]|nr:hypothetical protein [Oscillospiraceae bacterium]
MSLILIVFFAVLAVLLLGCLVVLGCDFVPMGLTFVKRLHIGRYSDEAQWRAAAEKKALQWLKKMPPLPITDETHYTLLPRLQGKYVNRDFLCWQQASLLFGLEESAEAKKLTRAYFEKCDVANAPYTIGNTMLLYALLKNGFAEDPAVKAAADKYAEAILRLAGSGTLPYQPKGINRFVDTLGMVCPFLTQYALLYSNQDALSLVKRQMDEYASFGIHPATGLPVHCFNGQTKAPLGVYGWGRGCGWYAIALAECCDLLDGKDAYAAVLNERMERFANALQPYQNKNGSFNCLLGAASRADSSATAVLGWFLSRSKKTEPANKAKQYLMSVTRRNGEIDFAQGDTMGLCNYSRRFEPLPFAQGFALRIGK